MRHSVLALAWSSVRRAELAEFADRVGRRFPLARLVVLVDRRERGEELLAYELGAVYVCSSPRQLAAVAGLARRHLGPQPRATGQRWTTRSMTSGKSFLGVPRTKKESVEHE